MSGPESVARPANGRISADWKICVGLALLILCAYSRLYNAEFVNYDDPFYVTRNIHVKNGITWAGVKWALSDIETGNWHPVTWFSHMLDCEVFGNHAAGHHIVNVLLHMTNSVLVFVILRAMTGSRWRSAGVAALFGLHPAHVESVAWISERKDVLSAFFGLLCLLAYTRYSRSTGPHRWRLYVLALLTFCLGLMAKPMLVTWPCVLLLLDFWPLRPAWPDSRSEQRQLMLRLLMQKIPFFVLSAISSKITMVAQRTGGAMASLEQVPVMSRIANAIHSYVAYMGNLLLSHDLAVIYPIVHRWPPARIVFDALVLGGIAAVAWLQRRRRPYLAVGWAWFVGTLVPVIGLVQVGNQAMADRYSYIPSIGFFLMIVWAIGEWAAQMRDFRPIIVTAISVLIVLCGVGTFMQTACWKNSIALFQRTISVTHDNFVAYNQLGSAFMEKSDWKQAKSCFQNALAINPVSEVAWRGVANALIEEGDLESATSACATALKLNPKSADAHAAFGLALMKQGRVAEAISEYQAAIDLRPDLAEVHYNLANALVRQGLMDVALEHFRESVRLDPDSADARSNFGFLLSRKGSFPEAITQFRKALAIQPGLWQARYGLASALDKAGQHEEAASEMSVVRREHPELFREGPKK